MKAGHNPSRIFPDIAAQILERIESARRPLLLSHVRLDGDALGAELALAHILKARGLKPHVVNDSPIPQIYKFLPGAGEVATSTAELRSDYDLAIALDLPSWSRADALRKALPRNLPIVSIDHHPPIERIGDLDWVDTGKSSVGEMIYLLAVAGRWVISPEAATCLYVAILTDTGRFTFPNTTAKALHAAADLVQLGAQHILAAEKIYQETSLSLLALRTEALQNLRLHAGGKIAVMRVTEDMMTRAGVDPIDTQEMPDYPRSISGVVVGILLREMQGSGKVKVSLRSRHGVDIEPIARKLGGGGHHEAAGYETVGGMEAVEKKVVGEITQLLQQSSVVFRK